MIRKAAILLALVVVAASLCGGEPGRRRPVRNPQFTVDGVIASVSSDSFRVQTRGGVVELALTIDTMVSRSGELVAASALRAGDYALTDALQTESGAVARNVRLFTVPASAAAEETVHVEGIVAAVSVDTSELKLETRGGILAVATNETTVIRREGVAIHLADITVGSFVRVLAKHLGERSLLALEIDVAPGRPTPRPMVFGEVVEVHAADGTLLVHELAHVSQSGGSRRLVRTNDRTEIYRFREPIPFDAIRPGDFVLAQGVFISDGSLVASRIDVTDPPMPPTRIAGRVLEVSNTTRQLVVAVERGWIATDAVPPPVTVIANDTTKIVRDGEPVSFDAIHVGDFVKVAGEWQNETTILASLIVVSAPPPSPMPSILGEIAEIDIASRTLLVRVTAVRPLEGDEHGLVKVHVDGRTEIFRNGQPITLEQLMVGDVVHVIGDLRDDGTIVAHRIDVIVKPLRPAEVSGFVVAVLDRGIELIIETPYPTFAPVHVLVLVGPDTQIVRDGHPVALPAVQIGDRAWAVGAWQGERTLLARKIVLRSTPEPPPSVSGIVSAIAGRDLEVVSGHPGMKTTDMHPTPSEPLIVRATEETVIYNGDVRVRFSEIRTGDFIAAEGAWSGEKVLIASVIRLIPAVR